MTSFDDRKSAFENKFALDESMLFKAEARACKNFGLWVAKELGMSDDEGKALAVMMVEANLEEPGFDDVRRAVTPIIAENGGSITDDQINSKLGELYEAAQQEVKSEG